MKRLGPSVDGVNVGSNEGVPLSLGSVDGIVVGSSEGADVLLGTPEGTFVQQLMAKLTEWDQMMAIKTKTMTLCSKHKIGTHF